MVTDFWRQSKKIDIPPSYCALAFHNGWECPLLRTWLICSHMDGGAVRNKMIRARHIFLHILVSLLTRRFHLSQILKKYV